MLYRRDGIHGYAFEAERYGGYCARCVYRRLSLSFLHLFVLSVRLKELDTPAAALGQVLFPG
jgi:hypothetical protein